ncbi:hypothetical protein TcWFU_001443 [Taenia crassiceps]|uniref:Uncharacterized protein n=1 Tax=Taenia crassiceps TaxID=6207 RepID=A0ABR4Q7S5_9CEST
MTPLGLLLLLAYGSRALTLEEAKRQGNQLLLSYNTEAFDIGFHAGMACLVVYGILLTAVTMQSTSPKEAIEYAVIHYSG